MILTDAHNAWCAAHTGDAVRMLEVLGRIPAPSHSEDRRVDYLMELLRGHGAYTDEAKNVILPFGDIENGPVSVIMAHTDIVFPDTEALPMRREGSRLYAPGIGDDTANVVNLVMAAHYALETGMTPKHGVLVVCNSCEEGLGNLKGSRQIAKDFGSRMTRMLSLDAYIGEIWENAVGSRRYRITVTAQGGHSFFDYGNTNAIAQAARVISTLYEKKVPEKAKTTYNVGVISGGTTVNSICGRCEFLYEFRSEDRECLQEMRDFMESTLDRFRAEGMRIDAELLGDRPCRGDVNAADMEELGSFLSELVTEVTGSTPKRGVSASCDCNTTLAMGIASAATGTVRGAGLHTRDEWIDLNSMTEGMRIALGALLYCFER